MTHGPLGNVLHYIRGMVRPLNSGQATDAQLLERFLLQRDETAFETLVERHGPMVLGVGRAVLADAHAAEDVFQATCSACVLLPGKPGQPVETIKKTDVTKEAQLSDFSIFT